MRGTLSHYSLVFSKKRIERALVAMAFWDGNPREIWSLVLVVRLSNLAGRRDEITQISSLCFSVTKHLAIWQLILVCRGRFFLWWLSLLVRGRISRLGRVYSLKVEFSLEAGSYIFLGAKFNRVGVMLLGKGLISPLLGVFC